VSDAKLDDDDARADSLRRIAFLFMVVVGVLLLHDPAVLGLLCVGLAIYFLVVGLPWRKLVRHIVKLWGFALLLGVSYAFFEEDPDTDVWLHIPIFSWTISLNIAALEHAGVLVLRVLAVVLASQIVRAGDPRAIATGLRRLGVPTVIAASIDTVLSLLGDRGHHGSGMGGGRGTGGGGGGGRGRGDGSGGSAPDDEGSRRDSELGSVDTGADAGLPPSTGHELRGLPGGRGPSAEAKPEGLIASGKRLLTGDVQPILDSLDRQVRRGRRYAEELGLDEKDRDRVHDVGVIAGVSLTMLGIKALKILPSIPFAPGHKLVLLTPLYIVASLKTRSKFGATLTGLTMGSVAFLLGDGKYGIFEIAKHVVPGIICDLGVPVLRALKKKPGGIAWSLFGGIIAAGRFATIALITLVVQAPAVAYAILLPGFTVHITFGLLSGYVTYHLVAAFDRENHDQARDG
jgi:energy-coupling factor transporter transmembrane protein EcfT